MTEGYGKIVLTEVAAAEEMQELRQKEKEKGIQPDPEIDAFMKANTIEGKRESIETEYVLHILGLSICADTLVGHSPFPLLSLPCLLLCNKAKYIARRGQMPLAVLSELHPSPFGSIRSMSQVRGYI